MHLLVALLKQLDARDGEKRAEQVDGPVKPLQESAASEDEDGAHCQSSQDAPEQDAVLVDGRHSEGREDDDEDENVVYGQRLFNQVTGGELERALRPEPVIHPGVEDDRERHPHGAPDARLLEGHLVRVLVKYTEIDGKHRQNEGYKSGPQQGGTDGLKWHA